MLKIVVFDGGWGGEMVADYLEEELGVVEVARAIDWKNTPYENKSIEEIADLAEENLKAYFGKVDLVVLGGYTVGLAIDILRERHPEQAFIKPNINYDLILRARCYPQTVAVLASQNVNDILVRGEVCEKLPYSTLILPNCTGWEGLINDDLMTKEILRAELAWDFVLQAQSGKKSDTENSQPINAERTKYKSDAVLVLNTHYWAILKELEEAFGWQVRILNFKQKLLHDVCFTLKLRGVDGKRSK